MTPRKTQMFSVALTVIVTILLCAHVTHLDSVFHNDYQNSIVLILQILLSIVFLYIIIMSILTMAVMK